MLVAQLKAGKHIAVTAGIGGVGKTQLAIEAAHRYGRYFGGGVFWLSFADPAGITAEIADCGRAMRAFHDAEQLDLDTQVQRTLALWASDMPRMLIFDNCEDEVLLRLWRPKTGGCRVLVTSRKQTAWSPDLRIMLLPLEVLSRSASVQLLQQLAPRLTAEEAARIAQELGDLPLALHLAGSFLARYHTIAPTTYLAKLRSPDLLDHPSLQGRGVQNMPTGREPNVARAFALSFERLNPHDTTDILARQLLARAACLAPGEPFPRALLAATVDLEGDEEARELALTDALERLVGLGLLEQEGDDRLRLHRLLAAYTQKALKDDKALPAVERVVSRMAFQANETGIPQTMLPVLPHLRYLVWQATIREDETAAALFTNLGFYFNMVGAYGEAVPLYKLALTVREQILGAEHPDTATSLNNLALLYERQGEYGLALPLYERALQIRQRVLGAEHPDTARSMNNLAALYDSQGDYARALPLYERALAVYEQVLGSEHPDTTQSLKNLALLYERQGAYEQAQPLYERALSISEHVLGPDHLSTASSRDNLALLFHAQGEYERALPLYERALAIRERMLGSDHPTTAMSLSNLAALYDSQGEYGRALALYERALAIFERVLGPDHPDTASSLDNLAELYRKQGEYGRALPLYERALTVRERVLGPDHPYTAISLSRLAALYETQGQYELALSLTERALSIFERMLGSDHPHTAQSMNNLAYLYHSQREYERALTLMERALVAYERVLGPDHPDTALSLNNLALLHMDQGHLTTALPLLERAAQIFHTRLGPDHPDTQLAQQNLAELRRRIAAQG